MVFPRRTGSWQCITSSGREQVNRLQGPLIRNISNRTHIYIHMYIYIYYISIRAKLVMGGLEVWILTQVVTNCRHESLFSIILQGGLLIAAALSSFAATIFHLYLTPLK